METRDPDQNRPDSLRLPKGHTIPYFVSFMDTKAKKLNLGANIAVAVLAPLLFLLLAEAVLYFAGIKPLSLTEDPFVGFSTSQPLFIEQTNTDGQITMVTNPVKLEHFNPQSFPKIKAPGTYRIFSVGGSTAYVHPWTDVVSFSGWLLELLPEADKEKKWDVINAGGISYASYREANLIAELSQYQPDLFIVYSGHNEFLEERTYRKAAKLPAFVREASAWLDRTRTYTAMRLLLRKIKSSSSAEQGKRTEASKSQMEGEVDDVLAKTIGPTSYRRDDTLKQEVLEHYRASLERMARIAKASGAKVLYLTTPGNEKDCSPFKSQPEPPERDANVLYASGQKAFAEGRFPEAKILFQKALDEDICPLRALNPMRGIVKDVAEANQEPWIDFTAILEQKTQVQFGHNILGEPDFVDHVHLTIEDYRLIARSILDKMVELGAVHPGADWGEPAVQRVSVKVMAKVDDQMQGLGLHNIAKVLNWAGKHEDAARIAERALQKDTTSLEAIWSSLFVGAARERQGKENEAIPQYRRAVRLDPKNPLSRNYLAGALMRAGSFEEAAAQYDSCATQDPSDFEAAKKAGELYMRLGKTFDAIVYLRRAAAGMSQNANLRTSLGIVLYQAGRKDEAAASFRRALDLDPREAWSLVGLGHIADDRGDRSSAIDFYSRALSQNPNLNEAQQALSRDLMSVPGH